MQISVLLFGIAKDIVGNGTLQLDVDENCSVAQLKEKIVSDYPKFELLKHLAVAVNNEYGNSETIIKAGDEVALIPPVSGG